MSRLVDNQNRDASSESDELPVPSCGVLQEQKRLSSWCAPYFIDCDGKFACKGCGQPAHWFDCDVRNILGNAMRIVFFSTVFLFCVTTWWLAFKGLTLLFL